MRSTAAPSTEVDSLGTVTHDVLRSILRVRGNLNVDISEIGLDTDLYRAGLTSHATVNVMLAVEDTFGVELPNRLINRRTFKSIGAIASALAEIRAR